MKKSAKVVNRTPRKAKPADAASAGTDGSSPDAASSAGDEPGSNQVWRSTRLRAGHTNKIDYLKLHNTSSTAVATPTAGSASVATPSHRKRPGSSGPSGPASSRTPSSSFSSSVIDKRLKLSSPRAHSPATTIGAYNCPICSLKLSSSRSLDQHIVASHSDSHGLECVYCGMRLRTVKALQNHYVKQHRVHAPVPDCLHWRLTMQCRACGQSFRTAEHLAKHMDWQHSRCSSIVLMEKLPDNWRWQRDKRSIMESADAVEEEYDLAFPGRSNFYRSHPGMLESDMSIQLQPAAAAAAREQSNFDVYAFEDEPDDVDIDASFVAKPATPASASRRGRKPNPKQQQQQQKRRVTMEIDFDQLLAQRDEALDNEIDDQSIDPKPAVRHQQRGRPPLQQQQQQARKQLRQQQQPFATDAPHYVSSRSAGGPSPLQSFPCPICMTDMATLKSRDRHLLQRHPGVRAFACLECDSTFETYISLRRHVKAEHPLAESGAYKLLIAPGLRRRARQRVGTNSAALAAAAAASLAGGDSSNNAESLVQPFLCTVCGSSFDRVHLLSNHYAAVHQGQGSGKRQQQVRVYRQRDSGGAAVLQDSAASIDMDDFNASADSVGGNLDELKLTCELCSAQFEKITALERHIAVDHVDETPYECHQCPAYFPSFSRLRHHQRTVHRVFMQWKEPPQTVLSRMRSRSPASGGGGANTVLNLAVPLKRTDMAKVAYQQLRFFDQQSAANVNLESVLSAIPPMETVMFCDFCGETCHNKLELGRHLQSHSGKRLRFGCARCGQVFEGWNAKTDLVDHMKVDHLNKPRYRCNECDAQFKFSSLLKLHRERGCNSGKPLARPVVSYGCANCEKIICGEMSVERYQQHVDACRGPLNRSLPSSATVQPPPTAVISGLDGDSGGVASIEDEGGVMSGIGDSGASGSRTVQVTLPGSKEPVSVLIHLEGPVSQETLSQALVVQSAMNDAQNVVIGGGGDGSKSGPSAAGESSDQHQRQDSDPDVEPLQSLAQFAAAAADAADAEAAASAAAVTGAEASL
ncbi:hypothetical protein BOX15_Mlig029837g2 [Macrostomum lignano]|uniref:C2H2-type domain-containing protein n=2 Tax=Macrostomum lignano TaxID=282301 RepID=A0A1I8GK92_9PLAT|nr:hypothetical protein BOX15_Mlig029837g2 [Macrostomum lignano]